MGKRHSIPIVEWPDETKLLHDGFIDLSGTLRDVEGDEFPISSCGETVNIDTEGVEYILLDHSSLNALKRFLTAMEMKLARWEKTEDGQKWRVSLGVSRDESRDYQLAEDEIPAALKRELSWFNPSATKADHLPPLCAATKRHWLDVFGTQSEIAKFLCVSKQRVSQMARR